MSANVRAATNTARRGFKTLDVTTFEKALQKTLSETQYNSLKKALKDTGAILAGGSVLAAYAGYRMHDFDIYVQSKQAEALTKILQEELGYKAQGIHIAPAYDQSFFKKNNIIMRIFMQGQCSPLRFIPLDLMIIPNNIDPYQVVANFDLTFCSILYDGASVRATNPDHITNKRGILRAEYVVKLMEYMNVFIRNRMHKYTSRGFTIEYDTSALKNVLMVPRHLRGNKVVNDYSEWVAKTLMQNYSYWYNKRFGKSLPTTELISHYNDIQSFTFENVEKFLKGVYPDENLVDVYQVMLQDIFKYIVNPRKSKMRHVSRLQMESYYQAINKYCNLWRSHTLCLDPKDPDITLRASEIKAEVKPRFKLPTESFDIIMYEKKNLNEFLKQDPARNVVILMPSEEAFCFVREDLDTLLMDQADNWLYECTGRIMPRTQDRTLQANTKNPYVGIPTNSDNFKGYVPVSQLLGLLCDRGNTNIYAIVPKLGPDGQQMSWTHTISFKNAFNDGANFVSANHCQRGSNIMLFEIVKVMDQSIIKGGRAKRMRTPPKKTVSKKATKTPAKTVTTDKPKKSASHGNLLKKSDQNILKYACRNLKHEKWSTLI